MKKLLIISAISILTSCGNSTDTDKTNVGNTDSSGLSNPVVIDTLKHPSGVDNSSVISTDTAAINVQNTYKKADSVKKAKTTDH
jgi:hypothetical protein